jgi:tight adherence protein B
MRAIAVGVAGGAVTVMLARSARRRVVVERLRPPSRWDRWIPDVVLRRIAGALDAAALPVDVGSALQLLCTVALGIGFVGATAFGSVGVGVIAAGAVLAAGPIGLMAAHGRRDRALASEIPATIDRIASELRAGGTVNTAIATLAESDFRLASDFTRMRARCELGAPVVESLRAWSTERQLPGVDVAAGALAMCAAVGGRAADALEGLAISLRDRSALAAEARALSAQARMSAYVVGGTPLLYLAWSAVVDRGALHAVVGTPIGRVCLLIGCALEVIGALWMRRILRAGSVL